MALLLAMGFGQVAQFRATVEVLQFQVQVEDAAGVFASGLTVEDFLVEVDGEVRPALSAYEVNLDERAARGSVWSPDTELPAAAWRQWVLLFDAAFNSPRGIWAAQEAARTFLARSVLPQDLVGVVSYNPLEGVRLVVPLTRDRRQVREAVDGLGLTTATRRADRVGFLSQIILGELSSSPGEVAQDPSDPSLLGELARRVAAAEYGAYQSLVAGFVEQMGLLGEMLQVVRGRKHVVFFTEGFEDRLLVGKSLDQLAADRERIEAQSGLGLASVNPEETFGSADVRSALETATQDLRAADAVLHMVDVAGLGGGRDAPLAGGRGMSERQAQTNFASGRSSLTAWADGTGGSVTWNENDLAAALGRLELANRRYYVLSVPVGLGDPPTADIRVRLRRADLRVRAAPTRLARSPAFSRMSEAQRQAQLAEVIAKGIVERDLGLAVAAIPFLGRGSVHRLALVVEIPWRDLESVAASRGDARVALDIVAYVVTPRGTMTDMTDRHVELAVPATPERDSAPEVLRVYDLLWVQPGGKEIRVVVRDSAIGRITSTSVQVEVPDLLAGGPWISGPVLIDTEHPGHLLEAFDQNDPPMHRRGGPTSYPFALGSDRLTPSAAGVIRPGKSAVALVVVNGLAQHPFTGRSLYTMNLQLVDVLGHSYEFQNMTHEAPPIYNARGRTSSAAIRFDVPAEVAIGPCQIFATVVDHTTGVVIRSATNATVEPPIAKPGQVSPPAPATSNTDGRAEIPGQR